MNVNIIYLVCYLTNITLIDNMTRMLVESIRTLLNIIIRKTQCLTDNI